MTKEQIELLRLGIRPIDERVILICEAGLEWIKANTILDFDINNDDDLKSLPSCVRLFIVKFFDINMLNAGVSSESIENLSQSFNNGDKDKLLWQFANELLSPYIKNKVHFVPAQRKYE